MNDLQDGPLITTVIPTFRRPHLLPRAIRSSLDQSFRRTSVCVFDNASGDETSAIVSTIARDDTRVRYFAHAQNIGAAANFAFGLERVDTPFFSFLSDDDFLLPGFYEAAMASLAAHPECAFFAGSVISMTDEGRILYAPFSHWHREGLFTPEEGFLNTIGASYPVWTGIVFRTSSVREAGGLDLACGAAADLELVSRMASRFSFEISKRPCAVCVNHAGSSSKLPQFRNIWPGWRRMMKKVAENDHLSPKLKREALCRLSNELADTMVWLSFRATLAGRFYLSRRTCVVLRKTGQIGRARRFAAMNRWAQRSRVVLSTLVVAGALRRAVLRLLDVRRALLNARFGTIAERLKK
jgi:glycosyltransferase involved in cell wall biosynthesis